jgi:hypothetical protein
MTHITIKREVLEQAIDAFETIQSQKVHSGIWATCEYYKNEFRTALEAKDVEPYVWLYKDDMGDCQWFFTNPPEYSKPLYAYPAPDARLVKWTQKLCDRIYDEGCTPLDWAEYSCTVAMLAAVKL